MWPLQQLVFPECPHTCALLFQDFWGIQCSNCAFSLRPCLKIAYSSEGAKVSGIIQLCWVYETYGLTYIKGIGNCQRSSLSLYLLGREV